MASENVVSFSLIEWTVWCCKLTQWVKGRVAQKNECGYVTFISQEVANNTNYTKKILRLIFFPNISISHTIYDTDSLT